MDQYHSHLAHHILELAPRLDLPVLLIIDAPFPTFVHHMSLAPLSRIDPSKTARGKTLNASPYSSQRA